MTSPSPSLHDNVFINCPFDKRYKPIFNAIVFAIHDAGFVARCSLEVVDSGPTRLATIISIIAECTYGIHDISRTETGGKTKLPRFNMPLNAVYFGVVLSTDKKSIKGSGFWCWTVSSIDIESPLDISGQDIKAHDNDPRIAIDKVRSWLNAGSNRKTIPGGKAIWDHYVLFQKELTPVLKTAGITRGELNTPEYYPDYVTFIVDWLKAREAIAAKK